jgi:hypothetical protein
MNNPWEVPKHDKKRIRMALFVMPLQLVALFAAFAAATPVYGQQMKLGELYKCADGRSVFKVTQCSSANPGVCDIESSVDGKPQPLMHLPPAVVNQLVQICIGNGSANAKPPSAAAQPGGMDANGFKIGDTVSVNTAFGWMDARILKANGDSYFVHAQSGAEVSKPYPSELRRIGPINEIDRAHGLYALHDKVSVHVDGKWEEGEVVMEMGREYQVALARNRTAWAGPENLRFVGAQQKPAAPVAGQPPQAGMTSCAGKVEGRYSSSTQVGAFTVVFRQGKAQLKTYGDADEEYECWTNGKKIILRNPGKPNEDMPIDINDDGTLDTPMGEIKRKSNS